MNGIDLGTILGVFLVLGALFTFGLFYNRKIESLGNSIEGFLWLVVAIGVAVTLIGIGVLDILLDWNAFFIGSLAYLASGLPMVWGALLRFKEERERARKAAIEDVATETLA